MMNDQEIRDNFCAKPFKADLKNDKDESKEFLFEQLDVEDLCGFVDVVNEWVINQNKISTKIVTLCLPYIVKMIDKSYPDWSKETKDGFIRTNLLLLCNILFVANIGMLTAPLFRQKSDEELNKMIKEEQEKNKNG